MTIETLCLPDTGSANALEVIDILVKVGDHIEANQALLTLESDKATIDVPADKAGILTALKVKLGDKIHTGHVFAEIDSKASAATKTASVATAVTAPSSVATTDDQDASALKAPAQNHQPTVFKLPNTGSNTPVSVIELSVKVGDSITAGQTLFILESDKATMDVPAPFDGQVQKILIKVGDKVHSDDELALLLAVTGSNSAAPTNDSAAVISRASATSSSDTAASTKAPERTETRDTAHTATDIYAGPSVRRMARLLDVDLTRIKGTGDKGRITKEDIKQQIKSLIKMAQQKPMESTNQGFSLPRVPDIDFSLYGPIESKPLSRIKKLTAQNLSRNWLVAPHVTQFEEANISELETFRKGQSAIYDKQGIKLTPLVFIMKAVVGALKAIPSFNASLDASGEQLILKKYFHIGIAVDTPDGLVVPVIRDVDKKSIGELAKELADISLKARNQKLTSQDMQGSCFTISSLGGIGGTAFTPIINLPNVAILGISKASMKPQWDGQQFLPKLMLPLSLSYDHRVIDGAEAARFIVTLAKFLQDIRLLLL